MKTKNQTAVKRLLILLAMVIAVTILFLFIGITKKNVAFFMPKRLIKTASVLIVGYAIGYSTVTFQTITNNHILTPGVMGMDSLYMFLQTVIVFLFGSKQLSMLTGLPNFLLSVGAMILSSCLLFLLLFKGDGKNLYFLVLAGMILGGLFGGLSTFMQVVLDPNEFDVLQGKMFASFSKINDSLFVICLIITVLVFIITLKDYRQLDVLSLGQEHAINLGVPYHRLVLKTLIIISVLIAISTALVGPITFLGILVVSVTRQIIPAYHHKYRVTAAVLLSCFSLIAGLLVMERIFSFSTPLSVIINFVGGSYFIYLLIKESKHD